LDWLQILDRYGIAVGIAIAMAFYIWKSTKYIQDDLSKDLHQKFNRLEGIVIKLIDQQKKIQIEIRGLKSSYNSLVDIVTKILRNK
jgi:MFS superfamily sulfate permease-like transporter|tara:strand:- start:160 stop:417 length:258 start_codon:yes stop_codon:yes gene_type:complete